MSSSSSSSSKSPSSRVVPYSQEAERSLLGGMISDPGQIAVVQSEVKLVSEHFFLAQHQMIYSALCQLDQARVVIDFVSLIEELKNQQRYVMRVKSEYVVDLIQASPLTENLVYHAQIVRNTFQLRRIIQTCEQTCENAFRQKFDDIGELLESVEKEILAIRVGDVRGGLVAGSKVLESTVRAIEVRMNQEGIPGISSGFVDLDKETGGFQKSDLILLAARPGMGKTALALNFVSAALKKGKRLAMFSLEMSKEQLMERLLASEGRLDSTKIRRGDLREGEDLHRLVDAVREVRGVTDYLMIDDTPSISFSELLSRCRIYQRHHGLDMVIVDYLQLMVGSGEARKQGREREVSEISMGLKALAKELEIPVIAVAQLNRSPDARPDKKPRISDLRESGSMEQDADLILFVYRDEYYNPHSEFSGQAEVIIGKNRHGPAMTTVRLVYQSRFVSFQNLAHPEEETLLPVQGKGGSSAGSRSAASSRTNHLPSHPPPHPSGP